VLSISKMHFIWVRSYANIFGDTFSSFNIACLGGDVLIYQR